MTEAIVERDYEQEASNQGWKPLENFSGDPEKWVDAKTFVERGENYVGILKDRYEKLERRFEQQIQVTEDIKKYYQKEQEAKQREIDQYIKQLEQARSQAITNGDGQAFQKAENDLKAAQNKKAEIATTNITASTPQWALEWASENPWYGKDTALTALAETFAAELRQEQPFLAEKDFMEKVTERVKAEMPHKFSNPKKRQAVPDVEIAGEPPDSPRGTSGGGNAYKDLPAEAKGTFNRLVKEGIFKNDDAARARFAQRYFEE